MIVVGKTDRLDTSKNIGVTEQTDYRCRRGYEENTRLKELVADISRDNTILRETARGNYRALREYVG